MTIWKVICGNRGYYPLKKPILDNIFNYKVNEFNFKNPEKML